jgi:transposase-like protein
MITSTDAPTPPDLQLLKTDTRFRGRIPAHQRDALLDLYERGTLTAKAFAAAHGIKYPTFAVWVQQRRKRSNRSTPDHSQLRWVETVLPQPPATLQQVCCLEFAHGIKLTLSHDAQLPLAARLIVLVASANSQPNLYA